MKKTAIVITLALFALTMSIFMACSDLNVKAPAVHEGGTPTAVGIPLGEIVDSEIGASGGTITSIDGGVTLEIPAGALGTNTIISVQPITNNAPGGLGFGYSFGPDGTQFLKPVTLKFNYTDADMVGTLPMLTGIAFQDTDAVWYSLGHFTIDVGNHTISASTTHFTAYAFFASLKIIPVSDELKVSETREFKVMSVEKEGKLPGAAKPGDDELSALQLPHEVDPALVIGWSLNGIADGLYKGSNAGYGTIDKSGSHALYTAPIVAPHGSKNPVQVSADIKADFTDPATGTKFNKVVLSAPVRIIGDFKYNLTLKYYSANAYTGGLVGTAFLVADSASMKIELKDNDVVCSNFTNSMGTVVPTTKLDAFGNKSTWILPADGLFPGYLNITGCVGTFSGFNPVVIPGIPAPPSSMILTITGTSVTPDFDFVSFTGGKQSFPGGKVPLQQIIVLNMNDSIPTWESGVSLFAKLTPIE